MRFELKKKVARLVGELRTALVYRGLGFRARPRPTTVKVDPA